MIFAAIATLFLAQQQIGAKLILPGPQGSTVINYPSMQRCLAAKEAVLRQARDRAEEDRRRSGIIMISQPAVYCVPG